MQYLPIVSAVNGGYSLQLQQHSVIDYSVSAEIPHNLTAKIDRNRNFYRYSKPGLHKRNPQCLLINALQKSSAKLVINLKKHLDHLLGNLRMQSAKAPSIRSCL